MPIEVCGHHEKDKHDKHHHDEYRHDKHQPQAGLSDKDDDVLLCVSSLSNRVHVSEVTSLFL